MNPKEKSTILITCGPGLTDYLRQEVESLGYSITSAGNVGLEVHGDQYDTMRLNLYLRTAYNVLFLLKEFTCRSPEQLYQNVGQLAWEDIISPKEYLSVVGRIDTPSIDNTMYAGLKVKDAVVDRIMQKTGSRPDSGKERNGIVIHLYWKDELCRLYLNTSGQKISDRSYRRTMTAAPMRESLAAAIITAAGYDGSTPLVCPMCGSGTLPIEAAITAAHRVPALLRANFGFMHTKYYDADAWQQMRSEALKQNKKRGGKTQFKPQRIIATDIDSWAVEAARRNAATAGVDTFIEFGVCDFADTAVPDGPGIVLMNPEYGFRMGRIDDLQQTYKRIGDFFKQKCAGYTGYIFTGNLDLAKKVGLRTSRRIIFFNGGIECRLLKYDLYGGTRKTKTPNSESS